MAEFTKPKRGKKQGTMKIGYARVSTTDQNLNLQIDALEKAGCEKIYQEKASGAKSERPELDEMMKNVRRGDVIVIWKLDPFVPFCIQ